MPYILIIRNTTTDESHVWEAKQLNQIVRKFLAFVRRTARDRWPQRADDLVKYEYRTTSATELARRVSKIRRKPTTKNAVIGRYRRIMTIPY